MYKNITGNDLGLYSLKALLAIVHKFWIKSLQLPRTYIDFKNLQFYKQQDRHIKGLWQICYDNYID